MPINNTPIGGDLCETTPHVSDDRGEVASTVVMVVVAMSMFLLAVQAALTFHARSVLSAAAQDYVRAVQTETGGDGAEAAAAILAGSEGLFVVSPSIVPSVGVDTVAVTISAEVKSVLPGWSPHISATAAGATERFRAPPER